MPQISKREWKNSDGSISISWCVRYRDPSGVRRSKQFNRKKDAERWIMDDLPALRSGLQLPSSESITIKQASEIWLDAVRRGRNGRDSAERSTICQYERHIRLHILPFLGAAKLTEIQPPYIVAFRDKLLDEGRSRAMVRKVLASLGGIFAESKSRGFVAINPVREIGLIRGSRKDERVVIPSKEEIRALINLLRTWKEDPPRVSTVRSNGRETSQRRFSLERAHWFYILIRTIAATGLRASEARGLRWQDLDLSNRILSVAQRADELGHIGETKTAAGRRKISLPSELVRELEEWRAVCPHLCSGLSGAESLYLVFPNGSGRPERLQNIYRRFWMPAMKELGFIKYVFNEETLIAKDLPMFGLHALRHFRASILIESGADLKEIQHELGHSSAQMTLDVYGHLFHDEERSQARKSRADKLDALLFS